MEYWPKIRVARFEELQPGDLFFIEHTGAKLMALKAIDPESNDESVMVLLGPAFPPNTTPGQIVSRRAATVISFGPDYMIHLPTIPSAWVTRGDGPPPECLALGFGEEHFYIRAYFAPYPGTPAENVCHVRLGDSILVYGHSHGIRAYATDWTISIKEDDAKSRPLLQVKG